ncbi:MAG: DUF368 domain-containing protein [Candidatus Omnitrophota bacterium]
MKRMIKETVVLFLKGGIIGIANIIPGVSGGTLAVMLGIYDRFIEAIAKFFEEPSKRWGYTLFLIKIMAGAGVALVLLARVMIFLLTSHFYATMFLFIGLILGGVPAVIRSHGDMRIRTARILAFVLGMIVVFGIGLVGKEHAAALYSAEATIIPDASAYPILLAAGFFAGGAMVVPGISGSFILVLLGQYAVIIAALKDLALKPLGVVAAGAVIGILLFSKIIDFCLRKIPSLTYYFILGLILASVCKIFPGLPPENSQIFLCAGTFTGGIAISYLLARI